MIHRPLLAAAPLVLAVAACQPAGDRSPNPAILPQAELLGVATIALADGTGAGTARLTATGDKVAIQIGLTGLPKGIHAVHLHMTGTCGPPDFSSAGGHLNPAGHQHGTANPQGAHLGDLPNAEIAADGSGNIETALRATPAEALAAIFDGDGTAVVVHADPDDYKTDPAGAAGKRIACGVLNRS